MSLAAGVPMAQLAGVAAASISGLSFAFVAPRVLRGGSYLAGWVVGRSLAWFGALGCVLTLLALAAPRVA